MPLGTRIGDLRSGPPPVGKTVSFRAVRLLTGTEGYSRRAVWRELGHPSAGMPGVMIRTLFHYVLQVFEAPQMASVQGMTLGVEARYLLSELLHDAWVFNKEEATPWKTQSAYTLRLGPCI